jgi:ABC-2 type transport system ATP-binding protein/lipopolysaccharide transport system ATP-binding protein
MTTASIDCHGLSKSFVIRANRQYLLKDIALGVFKPHLRERRELFWAVRDVDFAVVAGETVAVIGPNGAGKTTLFRLISQILRPTSGTVRVHGRLAPLLGLALGFHPELTGRENIYLSAALFGFTTREIRAAERDIIDFSELGGFIDVATKNYSSGMQLRLGFSIAVQVHPEIFLIDEILAVGDEGFQQKCLRRLEEERRAGRTFVIATHDMQFVEERCDRAILLVHGRVEALGRPKDVVRIYRGCAREQELMPELAPPAPG